MNEQQGYDNRWDRLKVLTGLTVIAFAVTLAIVVGSRLSNQALAVLAGAVCGVGAAIPTSLLIVAVSRRRDEPRNQSVAHHGAYPPVVVVAPPGVQRLPDAWHMPPLSLTTPTQRHFTVVGGSPADMERTAPYAQNERERRWR